MGNDSQTRIRRFMDRMPLVSGTPTRIAGDASAREFYRVSCREGTAVLMLLEEAPAGNAGDLFTVRELLAACEVKVPEIYAYDSVSGTLLVEDFGDCTLEQMVRERGMRECIPLYREAIDELLKIQLRGTLHREECVAFHRFFDEEKLMQELEFFLTHTVRGYFSASFESGEESVVYEVFQRLAAEIASYPMALTHRDYHSRNLMVMDDSVRIVDFQDARMGPYGYDLVSLLKDSYTVMDNEQRGELVEYYLSRSRELGIDWYDRVAFLRRFGIVGIQRNLKACGTFGYMAMEKENPGYLEYLAPTFAYVKEAAGTFEGLDECMGILSRHIPMLR